MVQDKRMVTMDRL